MNKDPFEINMDLDVEGLMLKVDAACDFIIEYLNTDFYKTKEQLMSEVRDVLSLNRCALTFYVDFHNKKMSDLSIMIDIKRKRISAVSPRFKKKRAALNTVLRIL